MKSSQERDVLLSVEEMIVRTVVAVVDLDVKVVSRVETS
jgi:hypothetical protein